MMWQNMYCCIYKVLARALGSDYALASSSGFPLHYAAEVFTGAPAPGTPVVPTPLHHYFSHDALAA